MKTKRYLYYIMIAVFLAGIYRGHIAIWSGEDPEPQVILPYSADLLTESDRLALEKGMRLSSREDLIRFMEDFCS